MHTQSARLLSNKAPLENRNDNDVNQLLKRLGVNSESLSPALKQILQELGVIAKDIKEDSFYVLVNWADVFYGVDNQDINAFLDVDNAWNRGVNTASNKADKIMMYTYLTLNMLGLALSIVNLIHGNTQFLSDQASSLMETSNTVSAIGWNGIDTVGGFMVAIRQFQQGDIELGLANLISNLQLLGCTLAASIAQYTPLIEISSAAIGGLMGFSFAACMFISGAIEICEVYRANQRINKLEGKRKDLSQYSPEYKNIQKIILVEHAQRENHKRAAKSWFGCGVAMAAVAGIGLYITLSGVTCGILPVATVIGIAAAVFTGVIRTWWVNHKNHVENLKSTLKTPNSLLDRINAAADKKRLNIDFDQSVTIKTLGVFTTHSTFRQYLEKLLVRDPKKLESVLLALEDENATHYALRKALSTHQDYKIEGGFGKTMGRKILAKLLQSDSVEPQASIRKSKSGK